MSARKKPRHPYVSPSMYITKKSVIRKKRDKATVFGTKNSNRIQFSPAAGSSNDYVTPQMNQILTLPRAPAKKRSKKNISSMQNNVKANLLKQKRNYLPHPLLLGSYSCNTNSSDDIDESINNIDNSNVYHRRRKNASYLSKYTDEDDDDFLFNAESNRKNSIGNMMMKMGRDNDMFEKKSIPPSTNFSLEMNGFSSFKNHKFNFEKNINALLNTDNQKQENDDYDEMNNDTEVRIMPQFNNKSLIDMKRSNHENEQPIYKNSRKRPSNNLMSLTINEPEWIDDSPPATRLMETSTTNHMLHRSTKKQKVEVTEKNDEKKAVLHKLFGDDDEEDI